jgi:hypothetical protein
MEFTAEHLADGVAATSPTVVYTVPAGVSVILTGISCMNRDLVNEVAVHVLVNFGTGYRYICSPALTALPGGGTREALSITLGSGDTVQIYAGSANTIDYVLGGMVSV